MKLSENIKSGSAAEKRACLYLKKQGLALITTNYRCRHGEIDLIMRDRDILVFIEVRMRKNDQYGIGIETVITNKQNKITKTALHFLQRHHAFNQPTCRFDVIGVSRSNSFQWIKNAFEVQ